MKELKKSASHENGSAWVKACMESKPRFGTKEEAIEFYTKELNLLAQKRGTTIPKLLSEAETAFDFDEDLFKARGISMSLSALKK